MLEKKRSRKKILLLIAAVMVGLLLGFFFLASIVLEPQLRKRLHTLIIDGSDSLYQYSLGSLHADLFGANVGVQNLKVWVDSSRFRQMRQQNTLPSLTINLDMKNGQVKGIGLLALLIGNKIKIQEISTEEGQLTLARHYKKRGAPLPDEEPFWKSVKPSMEGIAIEKIKLDNIQFAYWDLGSKDVQLRFRRCDAVLEDIKLDSAVLADTTRLGYLRSMSFHLQDLAYLSADSVYKMNVGAVKYSSANRQLAINGFHLQPSNTYDQLLRLDTVGKTYFALKTDNILFWNMRLEKFITANTIRADSMIMESPSVSVYFDRSAPKDMQSKVGNFPHQLVAEAPMTLAIKQMHLPNMQLTYTEKSDRTEKEGQIALQNLDIRAANVTNDSAAIKANSLMTISGTGKILGSPLAARFTFYLGSANGRFDAEGTVKNLTAPQLNPLAESLASIRINSLQISEVNFALKANDQRGWGRVTMLYNGFEVEVLKQNKETGDVETKRFLSNLVNRYMAYPSNPGPDGTERVDENASVERLLWHSFFGLVWKTIFIGMQNIILKS